MAFPTTSIIDDFNRTNTGPPLSSSWTISFYATAGLEVVSNRAQADAASQTAAEHRNTGTYGPDSESYITLITRATTGDYCSFFVDARLQSPTTSGIDGYEVEMVCREGGSNVNIVRIWKIVDNSYSQLGSDISLTIANGDSFGIEVTGTGTVTIKAWHKPSAGSWTELGSRTDSSSPINAAGYIGFGVYDSDSVQTVLDDFGGGTVVAGGGTLTVNKSESITVTEDRTVSMTRLVNKPENIAVSESQSVQIVTGALTVNVSENVAATESANAAVGSPQVNKSESVTVAESASVSIQSAATLSISVSDDITLIEPTFFGFESLEVNKSESITVSENHSETVGSPQVNVSESVSVTENHAELVTSFVGVSDTVTLTENHSELVTSFVGVSDAVGVAEDHSELVTSFVGVSDTATLTENAAVLPDALAVDVSDGVSVVESVSVNLPIAGVYTVNVNESITQTENVGAEVGAPQVSVSDAVELAESAAVDPITCEINASDSVTLTENVSVTVLSAGTLTVSTSDNVTLTQNVGAEVGAPQVSVADAVNLAENFSVIVPSGTYSVSVNDAISASESVLFQVGTEITSDWSRFNKQWQRARKHFIKTGRFHK